MPVDAAMKDPIPSPLSSASRRCNGSPWPATAVCAPNKKSPGPLRNRGFQLVLHDVWRRCVTHFLAERAGFEPAIRG